MAQDIDKVLDRLLVQFASITQQALTFMAQSSQHSTGLILAKLEEIKSVLEQMNYRIDVAVQTKQPTRTRRGAEKVSEDRQTQVLISASESAIPTSIPICTMPTKIDPVIPSTYETLRTVLGQTQDNPVPEQQTTQMISIPSVQPVGAVTGTTTTEALRDISSLSLSEITGVLPSAQRQTARRGRRKKVT